MNRKEFQDFMQSQIKEIQSYLVDQNFDLAYSNYYVAQWIQKNAKNYRTEWIKNAAR